MLNLIKSKKITILTFIFISLVLSFMFSTDKKVRVTPIPTDKPVSRYKELSLGMSTRNDVIKEIGSPQKEYTTGGTTYIEYETNNPNYNDQFLITNDKLSFIKKVIVLNDETRLTDLESKYGEAELIMYGPGSGIGLYLYAHPSKGIAYLGHKKSGLLNEIWYFDPTNADNFKTNFATNYSEEQEVHQ